MLSEREMKRLVEKETEWSYSGSYYHSCGTDTNRVDISVREDLIAFRLDGEDVGWLHDTEYLQELRKRLQEELRVKRQQKKRWLFAKLVDLRTNSVTGRNIICSSGFFILRKHPWGEPRMFALR